MSILTLKVLKNGANFYVITEKFNDEMYHVMIHCYVI